MNINKPEYLIIHHEAANNGFNIVNQDHKVRFDFKSSLGFYIGYHYYIDKNGIIKQGRADNEEGAHCIGYNTKSLAICCQGNFDLEEPTTTQRHNLRIWIQDKMKQYNIPADKVVGHRKFAKKSCPGKNLTDQQLLDMATYQEPVKVVEQELTLLQKLVALLKQLLGIKK